MKTFTFNKSLTETQRDNLILTLRHAGFHAAREVDTFTTDACALAVSLTWGNSNWRALELVGK